VIDRVGCRVPERHVGEGVCSPQVAEARSQMTKIDMTLAIRKLSRDQRQRNRLACEAKATDRRWFSRLTHGFSVRLRRTLAARFV
jgi:hypothetical protein